MHYTVHEQSKGSDSQEIKDQNIIRRSLSPSVMSLWLCGGREGSQQKISTVKGAWTDERREGWTDGMRKETHGEILRWFPALYQVSSWGNGDMCECVIWEGENIFQGGKYATIKMCRRRLGAVFVWACFIKLVNQGHTGLGCPLHKFIGECSNAFAGFGGQGEGVLCVCFQTLNGVRVPWLEGQLLLRAENRECGISSAERQG